MVAMKRCPSMQGFRRGLGLAIRNRRKALRLSQEQLAERLDMHRNYISLVERGIQNITVETLFKLSRALDCSPSTILDETESLSAPFFPPAPSYPSPHAPVWRAAEPQPRP